LEENKKAPICLFPFYALYYRGDDQKIGSCCLQTPLPSKMKGDDIYTWFTSDDAIKIRQQFMDGEWPDSCKICMNAENSNVKSYRQRWEHNLFKAGACYDDLDVEKGNSTGHAFFTDLRPDNFCNLSCSMCNPGASSKIEQMVKDLDISVWGDPERKQEFTAINTLKTAITKHTKRLKLNGGEPTINNKIKSLYQYSIDNDFAKNIELQFTTNFTNYNKTFQMLDNFKSVIVTASLDGTRDTYNYIRTPAKWNTTKKNIIKFKEQMDARRDIFNFGVNTVWYVATAFTVDDWLPELLDFFNKHFPHKAGSKNQYIHVNQAQNPIWQNLSIIPPEYRDDIYENIERYRSQDRYAHQRERCMDQLIFGLDNFQFNPENLRTWQELNPKMDAYKKVDITTLHPRFKDLMNYNV